MQQDRAGLDSAHDYCRAPSAPFVRSSAVQVMCIARARQGSMAPPKSGPAKKHCIVPTYAAMAMPLPLELPLEQLDNCWTMTGGRQRTSETATRLRAGEMTR